MHVIRSADLPVLLAGVFGVVALAMVVWFVVTDRMLARRVRWLVLPSRDFNPGDEEIARFAAALGRCVKRGPAGRLGRSSSAVRVRLASAGSGRMTYELEVPEHAVSVVRSALYAGVVLDDPDQVDLAVVPTVPASPEQGAAHPSVEPPAEGLRWAHSIDGGDVIHDWTHDPDLGQGGPAR